MQPHLLSQASLQLSGSGQAMELGNRTRLIIPGITITNMGRIFKNPANIVPALAWMWFLAPRARWTRTWNCNQMMLDKITRHMKLVSYYNIIDTSRNTSLNYKFSGSRQLIVSDLRSICKELQGKTIWGRDIGEFEITEVRSTVRLNLPNLKWPSLFTFVLPWSLMFLYPSSPL